MGYRSFYRCVIGLSGRESAARRRPHESWDRSSSGVSPTSMAFVDPRMEFKVHSAGGHTRSPQTDHFFHSQNRRTPKGNAKALCCTYQPVVLRFFLPTANVALPHLPLPPLPILAACMHQMDYWVRTSNCKAAKSKHIDFIDDVAYSREQVSLVPSFLLSSHRARLFLLQSRRRRTSIVTIAPIQTVERACASSW